MLICIADQTQIQNRVNCIAFLTTIWSPRQRTSLNPVKTLVSGLLSDSSLKLSFRINSESCLTTSPSSTQYLGEMLPKLKYLISCRLDLVVSCITILTLEMYGMAHWNMLESYTSISIGDKLVSVLRYIRLSVIPCIAVPVTYHSKLILISCRANYVTVSVNISFIVHSMH